MREWIDIRSREEPRVALESAVFTHGLPAERARSLAPLLAEDVRAAGAHPSVVAVIGGRAVVGATDAEIERLIESGRAEKANAANLGALLHQGADAGTTVSATLEIAAEAGVGALATGGIGGVHRAAEARFDVSADLLALTRCPLAVVASGVKSILDVESTREALEALGVPVVGWRTERFPAFYLRESACGVDARFDDINGLAAFVRAETARAGRSVLVANPIPQEAAIAADDWDRWLAQARDRADVRAAHGRDATPALLGAIAEVSHGATLEANVALLRANAALAGRLAAAMRPTRASGA